MVRVSVVVRTKDRPEFLARALADVAAQSFVDWEIVVVNDGGDREATEAVVRNSAASSRTRVVDTEMPHGRCAAANVGVGAARAAYVVLHDDDDRWEP